MHNTYKVHQLPFKIGNSHYVYQLIACDKYPKYMIAVDGRAGCLCEHTIDSLFKPLSQVGQTARELLSSYLNEHEEEQRINKLYTSTLNVYGSPVEHRKNIIKLLMELTALEANTCTIIK